MSTGDQTDVFNRLASLFPRSWYDQGPTPVRDSAVQGIAANLSWIYSFYSYVLLQSRLATATGGNLDKISYDFLGTILPRRSGEPDTSYRARIQAEILRPRNTRAAILKRLLDLTGNTATVQEAWNPYDWGGYGLGYSGYGKAIGYGSLQFPNQIWVKAYRSSFGIPNVPGYGSSFSGYGSTGQGEYSDLSQMVGAITDAEIYAAIAAIISAGITAWVDIVSVAQPMLLVAETGKVLTAEDGTELTTP